MVNICLKMCGFFPFYLFQISLWLLSSVCSRFDVYLYHDQKESEKNRRTHAYYAELTARNTYSDLPDRKWKFMCYALKSHNAIRLLSYQKWKKKKWKHTRTRTHQILRFSVRAKHKHTHTASDIESNPTPNENAHASMRMVKEMKTKTNKHKIGKEERQRAAERKGRRVKGVQIIHYLFIMRVTFVTLRAHIQSKHTAFSVWELASSNHMVFGARVYIVIFGLIPKKKLKERKDGITLIFTAVSENSYSSFSSYKHTFDTFWMWWIYDHHRRGLWRWSYTNNRIRRTHTNAISFSFALVCAVPKRFIDFDNVFYIEQIV